MSRKVINDDTTVRAAVNRHEHAAIRRMADKVGMSASEWVRYVISSHAKATVGKTLDELAEEEEKRGTVVQMELF